MWLTNHGIAWDAALVAGALAIAMIFMMTIGRDRVGAIACAGAFAALLVAALPSLPGISWFSSWSESQRDLLTLVLAWLLLGLIFARNAFFSNLSSPYGMTRWLYALAFTGFFIAAAAPLLPEFPTPTVRLLFSTPWANVAWLMSLPIVALLFRGEE